MEKFELTKEHQEIIDKMNPDNELVIEDANDDKVYWYDWSNGSPKKTKANANAVFELYSECILEVDKKLPDDKGFVLCFRWRRICELGLEKYFE